MAISSGIGLYLGEDQLRVVKLRRTSRGVTLQRLGNVPTPTGAISGGVPLDVRLLAEGIRRLLKAYDVTGNSAAVGLPGRAATSRVLDLPSMSREEQRAVVAGEMEHYRMIPPGQGTFDFISLDEATEGGQSRSRLLLMAADKRIVDNYREALRLAGLQMSVLEPFSISAARATFPSLGEGSVAVLTMGARSTELAIFENSVLRYSRQIDLGALNLTDELVAEDPSGEPVATTKEG
ncbi:MAG: pilus assembly protein PilM, partial [Armatimonadetes bacterium]|nr:pilus assembly protein PilM [Armatimonadota bacterium]NIM23524.1 pilus assembly protein PilM [Armatimonadota bacterium]NIM67390.1 pilus assembly protein PilM [Armatimonadota bacterium]NIM75891.1 pilus assembly protein PilM [Armatimonadota bacterium]NIN05576.1 pilus assembly protein PilM [Armatimonadota bacterium]